MHKQTLRVVTNAVMLDFGAGTQSARVIAEKLGLYYVPLDIRQGTHRRGNVIIDLSVKYPNVQLIWLHIRNAVREQWGVALPVDLAIVKFIWMSPPCRTFSHMDAVNRSRGFAYRDFTQRDRPPLQPATTKHGKIARADDDLACFWLQLVTAWARLHAPLRWVLENPVGSLEKRPYMQLVTGLSKTSYMQTVHYCAYGKAYKKPTRLWTNLKWQPRGNSRNGKCAGPGLCSAMTGQHHRVVVTGGRSRQLKGPGSTAMKSSVPRALFLELSQALKRDWLAFHRSVRRRQACARFTTLT